MNMNLSNHQILLLLGICLYFFSCNSKKDETPGQPPVPAGASDKIVLSDEQVRSIGIEVDHVQPRVLSNTINVTGMLDVPPQNLVNITAPFGGFLRSTTLLQGMHIVKGQLIAVVENPEYIQLQQDFLDTNSQVEFLEKEFQRQEELARENVNAQKTLQRARADLNSMKAKNNGLRAKLAMLNIDPDKLGSQAIRSTIDLRSPIDGYVTQVHVGIGSFVSPTDVIFKIVDTDHLHAELVAFERDIPRIKIGQTIRFTLANEREARTAKVFLIGREISSDRTVRVHGHIDKEDRELIPGMYLKATIEAGGQPLQALPEDAVLNFEDRKYIFIQEEPNSFRQAEIKTGVAENGYVEVSNLDGTSLGNQKVVIKGAYKLLSKMKNEELGEEPGH
jgi:cobalt-zinc-cadmium efflux system membrane fusion protein